MGLITVVRHGQASTFAREYDLLTPTGHEQARRLGEYWVRNGIAWDRVLVGPRVRHRQTEEEVGNVYRAHGLPWPEAERVDELDELDTARAVLQFAQEDPEAGNVLNLHTVPEHEREDAMYNMFRYMTKFLRYYATGEFRVPEGSETWQAGRARAKRMIQFMAQSGKGKRVVAFSSGGFTGLLVGAVLEISDEKTIDLLMRVRNASYTSFFYSGERVSLVSFNSVPHLPPEQWTLG
jgi:broad specificity phosphatase PhoE